MATTAEWTCYRGAMTPHDRRTLERYSRGEWSLERTCNHLGLTASQVERWLKEAGLPPPTVAQPRKPGVDSPPPGGVPSGR